MLIAQLDVFETLEPLSAKLIHVHVARLYSNRQECCAIYCTAHNTIGQVLIVYSLVIPPYLS